MVCIFTTAKIRFKGSECSLVSLPRKKIIFFPDIILHTGQSKYTVLSPYYLQFWRNQKAYPPGNDQYLPVSELELIKLKGGKNCKNPPTTTTSPPKQTKTQLNKKLRRISCICHQLLYLFTPHYRLCNAQVFNTGTGDTNCRILFDPCRLQSIESHAIWKLNLWGFQHVNESENSCSIDKAIILLHNSITSQEAILILTFDNGCITGKGNRTQVKMEQT